MAKEIVNSDIPKEEIEETKEQSLETYFTEELFPLALMYGMTSQEFWYGDPALMWSYRIFYENKLKVDRDTSNQLAWLQGLYIYDGVSKAIVNAFGGKGSKPLSYLDSPIDLSGTNEKKELVSKKSQKQFNHWGSLGRKE